MEDDYIPLPTVSRKYIDLPDATIINIMPNKKTRRKEEVLETDTLPANRDDQIDRLLTDKNRGRTSKNTKRPIPPPINTTPSPQLFIAKHKTISL